MPGTPINRDDGVGEKTEVDKSRNGQDRPDEHHQEDQPAVRELTQTDRLNKRLLESVLQRMSNSDEYDKFLDKQSEENDLDEVKERLEKKIKMFEDLNERDDHMSLSENEAQNSDGNERKSGDESEKDDKDEGTGRKIDPKISTKRIVRNPQPKLNAQRLRGPKGIHTIEKYFEGFKFHGKGHEKKDLDRIMKRLEHWAHRLFPKYQFDDFLEKVEAVGSKKELQSFLTKYRKDMDLGNGETAANDDDDDDGVERGNSPEPIDEFDMLIAEQIEKTKQATNAHAQAVQQHNDEIFNNLLGSGSQQLSQTISNSQNVTTESTVNQRDTSSIISSTNKTSGINVEESEEEIKKRIERNRQMAIEKRLARLKRDEENKIRKEAEQETIKSVESSQIASVELQPTITDSSDVQPQSMNVEYETSVMKTIDENVNSMIVDVSNTQIVDKGIKNKDVDLMIVDVLGVPTDKIRTNQQETSSTEEKSTDDRRGSTVDRDIDGETHDKNKQSNISNLLTDEQLENEIDAAVNQFMMQKRRLQ